MDQGAAAARIEIGHPVLAFEGGRRKIIAESEVQGKPGSYFEIILHKSREHAKPLIDEEDVGELSALNIAKQRISIGESGEGLIEGQRSSRSWLILKNVAHGGAQIDTELKRMPAPCERKIVNPLGLLRYLGLRQEIRRADESEVGKGDL